MSTEEAIGCETIDVMNTVDHVDLTKAPSPWTNEVIDKVHTLGPITLKDSGARQVFETGANRDVQTGKGRFDLLPPWAIEQLARLYEAGCLKYGDRNWEKGIPLARYLDSGMRHTFKALRGDEDEDHLLAACWNLLCAIDTRERIRLGILPAELDNLPKLHPGDKRERKKLP